MKTTSIFNLFVLYSENFRKIKNYCDIHFIYSLHVSCLQKGDRWFTEIVECAAKLICTTPEFDDLAKKVGLGSHKNDITNEIERGKLRAELDGIIAH